MSKSIFSVIQGLKPEDLTTEVLREILDPKNQYVPLRMVFFHKILGLHDIDPSSYSINSQISYTKGENRPDLEIRAGDYLIVIENKLTASFNGNQIPAYLAAIEEERVEVKKYLFLLCPKMKADYYKSELQKQIPQETNISHFSYKNSVQFAFIYWEEIIRFLYSRDFLVSNLLNYVQDNFIRTIHIGEKDMSIMNSVCVPNILQNVLDIIDQSRSAFAKENWNIGRLIPSTTSLYYELQANGVAIIVQYDLKLWQKYATPFVLQIDKNNNLDNLKLDKLLYDKDYNAFMFPIVIEGEDAYADFVIKCRDIIKKITE